MNYTPLNRALDRATQPIYPTDFTQIAEGYKEKYGERAYQGKLATAITGAKPPSQSGYKRGTPEYKAANTAYNTARRLVERHVTGEQKGFSPDNKARLEKAGQTLEPIGKTAPKEGLTIEIKFKDPGDKSHNPRERSAVVHLDHSTAVQYINQGQPDYAFLFDQWFKRGGKTYGEGGSYEVEVTKVSAA